MAPVQLLLMYRLPTSNSALAISMLLGLRENTPPVNAYSQSFAISIAARKFFTWWQAMTGPNSSVFHNQLSVGTSLKIVGGTKYPPCRASPLKASIKSLLARSICSFSRSCASFSITGPIKVADSCAGPIIRSLVASLIRFKNVS